mgnify:CR=1 FL=1
MVRRRGLSPTRLMSLLLPVLAFCFALAVAAPPASSQTGLPNTASKERTSVDLELVLAVDVSLSIDAGEARLQRDGYVAAFRDPQVLEAIKGGILGRIAVTYFEWANSAHNHLVVGWTLIDSPRAAEAFAVSLAQRRPGPAHYTSISGAIDFGATLFRDNGFDGTRQVIDVSGDGPNNSGRPVRMARDEAVKKGVTINGLPIVNDRPNPWGRPPPPNLDKYYFNNVIGGRGAFIVVAKGFKNFAEAIRNKMVREIAGRRYREIVPAAARD